MTQKLDPSLLSQLIQTELGASSWHMVSQSEINRFAELGGDRQWIHVDAEKAKAESPFGTTVAHGYYILALAPRLMDEIFSIKDSRLGINRGLNNVRFITPLRSGDRIRIRVKLLEIEAQPDFIDLKFKVTFEGEGYQKPVCVAEVLKRYHMEGVA